MVQVAQGLGMKTIAEFVEDAETLEFLRAYGVDYAQGYHVGRPQPIEELWPAGAGACAGARQGVAPVTRKPRARIAGHTTPLAKRRP